MSEKKTAKKTARPKPRQAAKPHAESELPRDAAFDDDMVEDELDSSLESSSEFDNEADDDAPGVDVSELDVAGEGEDEDELAAEEETLSVELDESTPRYAHESEIFGKKELSTSREKLELLREERALREMLGDSF